MTTCRVSQNSSGRGLQGGVARAGLWFSAPGKQENILLKEPRGRPVRSC